jgi:NDP-sugar pyrophosphorylase family protein
MEPHLVILAGGISSRMRKPGDARLDPGLQRDAETRSKSMIRIGEAGRPFLDYLLFNVREAGYRDIVIVVGEGDAAIRSYYGLKERGNEFGGLSISYALQPIPPGRVKPLGTADALLQALHVRPDWAGTRFTVCNSDNLYSRRALTLVREVATGCAMIDYDRDALEYPSERIEQFAVIMKNEKNELVDIVEKPGPDVLARARDRAGRVGVSMNVWRFPYDRILPCLEETPLHPTRKEKELPSAVLLLVRRWPGSLLTIPLHEHVPDLTDRDDILEVQQYLSREFPHFSFDRS